MRNKTILIILCILLSNAMMAEKDANRVRQQKARLAGLTLGYSQTCMFETAPLLGSQTTHHDEYNRYHGLQGGIVLNPEINNGLGILTGVQYSYTPTFSRIGKPNNYTQHSISQHELVIPMRFQYRYEFTPGFSIFAYTGPSFNVGLIWNKTTAQHIDGQTITSTTTDLYDDDNNYSRFHCTWGLGVGVLFNRHVRIEYCADWGLNNITPYSGMFTHLNRPVYVAVSYMF